MWKFVLRVSYLYSLYRGMYLKGCIWEIGQWLLYSLDLDCPDL